MHDSLTPGPPPAFARVSSIDQASGQRSDVKPRIAAFQALRARQPGFRGAIQVGASGWRILELSLWESEAQHEAARPVLEEAVAHLLHPQWAGASPLLGRGRVVYDSISTVAYT